MRSPDDSSGSRPPAAIGGRWVSFALIVISVVFLWSSLGVSATAARVPQLTLVLTLLALSLQAFLDRPRPTSSRLRPGEAGGAEADIAPVPPRGSILPAGLWLAVMLASLWLLGVSVGVTVFCLAYLRWYARERWRFSVAFALSLGLIVQAVFGFALQAPLYRGTLHALLWAMA